jgi:transcription elongation factor GreA
LVANEPVPLWQAVQTYVASVKKKGDHEEIHKELFRFLRWCGPDRTLTQLSPPEIGDYAERVGGAGTAPQAASHLQVLRAFLSYARKKGLIDTNLAQHVRIRKSKSRFVSSRHQDQEVQLTPEGHAKLLEELEKLTAERPSLAQQIQRAAADKDVRENVPLEAAREQLGHTESRIRTIESTLTVAVVIDSSGAASKRVQLGAQVSVRDVDSRRETTYTLVSATEANPLEGRISDASPLGKALLRRYVGEQIDVETPRGKTRYSILKVGS